MDKLIVFLIIAVAAGFLIRRFFFKKGNSCGCGCSGGGCSGGSKSGEGCSDAARRP
uniref:Virus attachment protein p12 family n=1 Tax=Desulfovibrio sp. U5L TaxID=596152 RepID=I2PXK3_9BACT